MERSAKYVPIQPERHLVPPQGVVVLPVKVGTGGRVDSIRLLDGYPTLVPKAIDAVAQWEFTVKELQALYGFEFDVRVPVKNSEPASVEDVRKVNAAT